MDEMGVPILAAADGIVTFSHDGEFDRNTQCSGTANAVIVTSPDGTVEWYWHMRKGSVRVLTGATVHVGDTLGFVGSSGCSSAPHLHFEVHDDLGNVFEPYQGTWSAQSFALDFPA